MTGDIMCTAMTYKTKDSYFGRNLDLEYSYNETVTITPRNYKLNFRVKDGVKSHYAMIGMAYVKDEYPLYYDGVNEMGVSMAGLNFPSKAHYNEFETGKDNVAPFEFIPFVLGRAKNIDDVKKMLFNTNIVNVNFSDELSASPLHWMIADKKSSIVVESVKDGLKVYDNQYGVLTNNPTFDIQLFNLNNYMHLSTGDGDNTFLEGLEHYSRGMGAIGLPGDWSSQSRFIKAAFVRKNSVSSDGEGESVNQFFHMLSSVEMPRGCVKVGADDEITRYSCCINADKGIYYYKTYENGQINAVCMHNENLEEKRLISYPLVKKMKINMQN